VDTEKDPPIRNTTLPLKHLGLDLGISSLKDCENKLVYFLKLPIKDILL
jgi:hypothetical protein